MITENLSTLKILKLSQAQYDRELEAGNIDASALYLTPGEEISSGAKEFVKVIEHRTTEDLTYISFTEDMNGNPLSFEEAIIFVAAARPLTETTNNGTYCISPQPQWAASFNQYGLYLCTMFSDYYVYQAHFKKITEDFYEIRRIMKGRIAASAEAFNRVLSQSINNRRGVGADDGGYSNNGAILWNNKNDKSVFNAEGKFYGLTIGVDLASSIKIGAGAMVEVWAR